MARSSKSVLRRGEALAKVSRRQAASRLDPLKCGGFSRRLQIEWLELRTLLSVVVPTGAPTWIPEGPEASTSTPIHYVGAMNQIAVDPNNHVHLLVATVNGGIWQTSDFTAVGGPVWTTTTDHMPSLSIGCVAFSPVNSNIIYAGTGQYSSELVGDTPVGVYKSTDGGQTWQVENPVDANHPNGIFTGKDIWRIVPTTLNGGLTVFAATTKPPGGGVYRSDDGGTTWTCLSSANEGLPNCPVTDLVANPNNANQFFAATSSDFAGAKAGVYMLDVTGGNTTWKNVTNGTYGGYYVGMVPGDTASSRRIELAISPTVANPIWAAIMNDSGDYQGVYRGVEEGGTIAWTEIGPEDQEGNNTPPDISSNGWCHGAIAADPDSDHLVYLSASNPPIVRGDSNLNTWTAITCGAFGNVTDNGVTTQPHMDSRGMVFVKVAGLNYLLQSDDGGVYQCTYPESLKTVANTWTSLVPGQPAGVQFWRSINGNIQDTEGVVYSYDGSHNTYAGVAVSYDSQFHIIFGGAQDVGVPTQNAQDSVYGYVDQLAGYDGGNTGVDNFSLASDGDSTRYYYDHIRRIFSGPNIRAYSPHTDGSGSSWFATDDDANIFPPTFTGLTSGDWNTKPYDLLNFTVVNAVAGRIIAAGLSNTNNPIHPEGALYESSDAGSGIEVTELDSSYDTKYYVNDTWTPIATPADFVEATAIAYGGNFNGQAAPDVLYVASGSQMYVRAPGGNLTATDALPTGAKTIISIALDPNNWHTAFITDGTHVYMTTTAGLATNSEPGWTEITGNLTNPSAPMRQPTLAVIPGSGVDAVLFAGAQGVLCMLTSSQGLWTRFGANQPNVRTNGILYNVQDNVLVLSTVGRGYWEIKNANTIAFVSNPGLEVLPDNPSGNTIDVRLDPANSNLLEILQNGIVEYDDVAWANPTLDIHPGSGNDTIEIENVPASMQVTVEGSASDWVDIHSSSQGVQGILGTVVVSGALTLTIDDMGDNAARIVSMSAFSGLANYSGQIITLAPGSIYYNDSAVSNVIVDTDAVAGNQFNVFETSASVTTSLEVAAVTYVTLGNMSTGVQSILGSVHMENYGNLGAAGDLSIMINDVADPTARMVSVTTFTPTFTDLGITLSDTPWGSIDGLAPASIKYEYADTNSVAIEGNPAEFDVIHRFDSGSPPIRFNMLPVVTSITRDNGPINSSGIALKINGYYFDANTIAVFGKAGEAAFDPSATTPWTPTQLSLLAPRYSTAGQQPVTVSNLLGQALDDSPTGDFYFDYLNPPTVTGTGAPVRLFSSQTTVDVSGSGFTGATQVALGSIQATSFIVHSDNWITATFPAITAGTYHLTVTAPGGTSVPSPGNRPYVGEDQKTNDIITFTAPPIVSTVYPQESALTGGIPVTIMGANFSDATEVDFGTTAVPDFTIDSDNQITVTSPAGSAGTVDVRVVSDAGPSPIVTNDEYTYLGPPTITSVSPQFGPYEGGTVVTIQGTNLSSVAPVVRFGGFYGTPGTILSDTGTQIVVTSPAHAVGVVDIQVFTTGGGSAISTADEFDYVRMRPIINSISPSAGSTGGGTTVTISGNYFIGTTMVYFGGTIPASFITVNSDTQITATSPPESAGAPVDVRVVAWGLESATTPQDHFTYEQLPVVSSISPSSGTVAGGTTVIVTGSNLSGATEVDFGSVAGTIVSGTNTAGQITVTSPPGTAGTSPYVTVVTTVGRSATSSADKFSYYIPVPVVTGLSPIVGDTGVWPTVTISGTNLSSASWVKFGTLVATIVSDTNNQIVVTGPAIGSAGTVDVTVNTAGGTSAIVPADQFTYGDVPNISALVRPTGGPGNIGPADYSGWQIDIDGANLAGATEVDFGASKVTSFLVDTATEIVVAVPNEDPGTVSLTVKTSFGTSAAVPYTYVPGPVIIDAYTANNTMDGPLTGGTSITIRGIHMSDAETVNFGSTAVTNFTYTDYGGGYGAITVTSPPSAAGPVYISVTSPEGTSTNKPILFYYLPVPTVSGISPAFGPTVGGSTVAISGTDISFTTGVFFGGVAATSFSYSYSYGEILAVAPAGSGAVDVTVTTDGGTSATSSADQFIYVYVPPPVVLGLSPTSSGLSGGVSVTIAGTDLGYATAVDFGGALASFTVNPDGTISAVAPMEIGDCTVDVTVTTLVGTSATSAADQFSYVGPPVVASLDTNTGSVYGGTRVTISGTDLASATAVRFGSNPATIVGETDDQGVDSLVVLSPEATGDTPGPVDITVNTPYGTTTDSSAFNYYLPPIVTAISTSVGPTAGGTALTISGTNLWSATAVNFGSIATTSFTYNYSDGTISTVSPTGSVSTVDVTVVNPGGTSPVSSADQFTYLPAPSVSGISPAAGTLSGGSSVLISGTGLSIATEVDFGGFGPASFTVNPDGTISAVAPPNGSGTKCAVDVTVTTVGGTSATSSADLFTYAAPPSVTGISPTWGNAAGGDIVTITGTNLDGATAVDFGASAGRIIYDSDSQIQAG